MPHQPGHNDEPLTAEQLAFRVGGIRSAPLPGELGDLYGLLRSVLTGDQNCDGCHSGDHPKLDKGLEGILDNLGWLLSEASDGEWVGGPNDGQFVDQSVVREAVIAALPAFAHLVYISIKDTPSWYRAIPECHPEFGELLNQLDIWLPMGGNIRALLDQQPPCSACPNC